jgi:hypothetical protein
MWRAAEAEGGRLLCLLLIWRRAMPADSGSKGARARRRMLFSGLEACRLPSQSGKRQRRDGGGRLRPGGGIVLRFGQSRLVEIIGRICAYQQLAQLGILPALKTGAWIC